MSTSGNRELMAALAKVVGVPLDSTYVADVVKSGDKIILPEGAWIPDVIQALKRKHEEETQVIKVRASVACPPWDGAMALQKAIVNELGVLVQNEQVFETFFGKVTEPAGEIEVEVEFGKTATVQWGEFSLPGMGDAKATTNAGYDRTSGQWQFSVEILCIRLHKARAQKVLDEMRRLAKTDSLHRGKAFAMKYFDEDGDSIPWPKPAFFPLDVEMPIFRRDLEAAIERNVFVPMQYADAVRAMREPLKRGILFAGRYGVGKTMLASHIARMATQCGWTFVYVKNPRELPFALKEALRLQPAIVFCEDVERVAGVERDDSVNELLNQLDGVDSKTAQIMTILTSNHPEQINPAMRRPGRIDLILQVLPPDEEAVARMVKHFSRDGLERDADLSGIQTVLAGYAPSHIREAVSRARLEALRRTGGQQDALISGEDLKAVALEIKAENELFVPKTNGKAQPIEAFAEGMVAMGEAIKEHPEFSKHVQ